MTLRFPSSIDGNKPHDAMALNAAIGLAHENNVIALALSAMSTGW
jgi:hypothetical protein